MYQTRMLEIPRWLPCTNMCKVQNLHDLFGISIEGAFSVEKKRTKKRKKLHYISNLKWH